MTTMIDSTETRFRASARFELKQLAELTAEQREPLRELENDPSFFGLLVPRDTAGANIKSVGSETAALLRRLATPAVLAIDDDIIDLVLDGVLEIERTACSCPVRTRCRTSSIRRMPPSRAASNGSPSRRCATPRISNRPTPLPPARRSTSTTAFRSRASGARAFPIGRRCWRTSAWTRRRRRHAPWLAPIVRPGMDQLDAAWAPARRDRCADLQVVCQPAAGKHPRSVRGCDPRADRRRACRLQDRRGRLRPSSTRQARALFRQPRGLDRRRRAILSRLSGCPAMVCRSPPASTPPASSRGGSTRPTASER